MKTKIKNLSAFMLVSLLGFVLLSFIIAQEPGKPWNIPAKYKTMKNPYQGENINIGKSLYMKHCRSCHGNKGLGDGPKAKNLKTSCGDFSSAKFQKYTDGEIYYQSIIGRDEMPNYEKKIQDDEDRWAVVNYIRTLKK
jgi:mono/diheme cytochrome c family protein